MLTRKMFESEVRLGALKDIAIHVRTMHPLGMRPIAHLFKYMVDLETSHSFCAGRMIPRYPINEGWDGGAFLCDECWNFASSYRELDQLLGTKR